MFPSAISGCSLLGLWIRLRQSAYFISNFQIPWNFCTFQAECAPFKRFQAYSIANPWASVGISCPIGPFHKQFAHSRRNLQILNAFQAYSIRPILYAIYKFQSNFAHSRRNLHIPSASYTFHTQSAHFMSNFHILNDDSQFKMICD